MNRPSRRATSNRFRPSAEALEGRSLLAVGQLSLSIPSAAVSLTGASSLTVRGSLPDGSIDVMSSNLATATPVTIGSGITPGGAGKVQFAPFEIVTDTGSQTGPLFQVEGQGLHFNTMTLTVRDGAARIVQTYSFKDVFVSSQVITASEDQIPVEDDQFVYGALQITIFNPLTGATITQNSFTAVTNKAGFDVPGVTASSLKAASISAVTTEVSPAIPSATIPTAIKLNQSKSHNGTTTLTARVTSKAGVPTGQVTFEAGKVELGQVPLDAQGRASLTVPTASLGKLKPFAIYSGGADSTFLPATTITNEAVLQKSFQKWLGRPMTQDEWVLTSMWLQEGFTPAKMATIYKSLSNKTP